MNNYKNKVLIHSTIWMKSQRIMLRKKLVPKDYTVLPLHYILEKRICLPFTTKDGGGMKSAFSVDTALLFVL